MTPRTPPRLARRLLGALAPHDDRPWLLGDLDEEHAARAIVDERHAGRWYRAQVARSLLPLLRRRLAAPATATPAGRGHAAADLAQDLRHAARLARRTPWLTAAVVGTMALAIGTTTAVFGVLDGVLLRPLPFDGAERVVRFGTTLRDGSSAPSMAWPDLQDYRREVPAIEAIAVAQLVSLTLTQGAEPQQLRAAQVNADWAGVFAVAPLLGRHFEPAEHVDGGPRVALLAHGFWQRAFGGDPTVVGRTVSLNSEPVRVVGVLPPARFLWPQADLDVVLPLRIVPNTMMERRGALWATAAAKLRPGVPVATADAQIQAAFARMAAVHGAAYEGIGVRVEPLRDAITGPVRGMLLLLAGVVAAVLLVACLNIANLLLGRSVARAHEFSIRAAIGGSARRLRRQLLAECLAIAAAGGALGVALAPPLTRALLALYPGELPRAAEIGTDLRVLLVALGVTLLAGLLAAAPMARGVSAARLSGGLRDGGRTAGSHGQQRASRVLIGAQVAISVALLFASALLLQTFERLRGTDPGFTAEGVTAFHVFVSGARHPEEPDVRRFSAALLQAVEAVPGVRAAATTTDLPLEGSAYLDIVHREDLGDRGAGNPQVYVNVVSPRFHEVLGIPVRVGRAFTDGDRDGAERVVVINEAMARRVFADADPVGRRLVWGYGDPWRVVGVVGDVSSGDFWAPAEPVLYAPAGQVTRRSIHVAVQADVAPMSLAPALRAALRAVDPTIAMTDVATMEERLATALAAQRFRAALMTALGALVLVLALLGIYGVVAQMVAARTREIGIRMALGEAQAGVRRRVLATALRLAAGGAAVGVLLALGAGRWLAGFLVGVRPHEPLLLAVIVVALPLVAAVAAYGPARRASRVDPVVALRSE